MRKLAFLGVILLGLMLLVTHLCATFTAATGLALIAGSFESGLQEVMDEVGVSIREDFSRLLEAVEVKDDPQTTPVRKEQTKQADQTTPSELNRSVLDDPEELKQLLKALETEPVVWKSGPITVTTHSSTYQVPGWLVLYGIMGTVIILCGTTFLAIACRKLGSSH